MVAPDYLSVVLERSKPLFALAADIMARRYRPRPTDGSMNAIAARFRLERCEQASGRRPTVSVIIPTRDRPDLLPHAVESAWKQHGLDLEVIVVNDSAVPLPVSVLEHLFASRCSSLTIVQHHRNLGLGAARNTGAALARGDWILMLDDDDVLVEGGVERLLDARAGDTEPVFLFGDHMRQWYNETARATVEYRDSGHALEQLHLENGIICGSFAIRRQTFVELGGYREDLPVHEDYNLHLRALSRHRPAYRAIPVCVYHCRSVLPRLNHKRLYWFATSAFNHAVFRCLFDKDNDFPIKLAQREYQYAHLARSLQEGCPPDVARAAVAHWWETLASRHLGHEIEIEQQILPVACPSLDA